MKKYYIAPTQIEFYDRDESKWIGGIAYRDEIICGECGGIIEIDELKDGELIEFNSWLDISKALKAE